jgi:hypothetical protein
MANRAAGEDCNDTEAAAGAPSRPGANGNGRAALSLRPTSGDRSRYRRFRL